MRSRRPLYERARRGEGAGLPLPLAPGGTPGPNLPIAFARFFGRGDELAEIEALMAEHRLVTLTGAGGIGKTQTALRAALAFTDAAEASVCFVSLAPIGDPSLVATAIAGALSVQEVPNHSLIETLVAFLKNKTTLLLLDNCEQVIAEAATVVDSLLHACPNLRVLTTSRESLRAAGERTYRLPSLDENDAVALFADRAQAADAHFTLTDEKRPVVGEICRHLSGIPLAIELAAARVTVLPVQLLAKALVDRLQVLIGGERTAAQRQQTMRAAIDWSYELLTGPEQRLFERLSMFEGGCTIDAARAVCQGDGVAADDVLSLISSLVGKSLLVAELEGNAPRYRLLEPYREYAREKLTLRGEEGAVAQRHLLAYISLARTFARRDQHYTIYYGYPRDEVGNWRAAVRWALTKRNDVLGGQRLVAEVVSLWGGSTPLLGDAKRWILAALELADQQTPPEVLAKIKLAEAHLAMHLDHHTLQLASAEKALTYYREAGDELGLVRSQTIAGNALVDLGRTDKAREILEEALSIVRKLDARWYTVYVLRNLAYALRYAGETALSRRYLTEALQLLQVIRDQVEIDLALTELAALSFDEGDPESAVADLTDLFARGFAPCGPRRLAILAGLEFSEYLIAVRRYEDAGKQALEALSAAREDHLDVYVAVALGRLATIAALRATSPIPDAQARAIAGILGFVEARVGPLGLPTEARVDPAFAALRDVIGADIIANLMGNGANMTEDEAVEAATAL